jgi:hypothetical protein
MPPRALKIKSCEYEVAAAAAAQVTATDPTPNMYTNLSPKLSTNLPEIKPLAKRANAKAERIDPTAALFTPNDLA